MFLQLGHFSSLYFAGRLRLARAGLDSACVLSVFPQRLVTVPAAGGIAAMAHLLISWFILPALEAAVMPRNNAI